jgi:hypothetical protein
MYMIFSRSTANLRMYRTIGFLVYRREASVSSGPALRVWHVSSKQQQSEEGSIISTGNDKAPGQPA